jgi:hypothetical protein
MGRKINSGLSSGVHGQLSFENFELLNKLNEQASCGEVVVPNFNNQFLKNINHRSDKDINNTYDIVGHGTPYYIEYQIGGMKKAIRVYHRDLARILYHRKDYKKGMSVRLLSCNTGSIDFGLAQKLANKLNAIVYAPNTFYWAYPNGKHFAAGRLSNGNVDFSKKGEMIVFYPGGRRK